METFYNWLKSDKGFKFNECVQLKRSELDDPNSGYGLYVDVDGKIDSKKLDGIELLRIPPYAAFNIRSILKIFNDTSFYATPTNCEQTQLTVKEAFSKFSQDEELTSTISETTILIFYFILIMHLEGKCEIPTILHKYLNEVLLKTFIKNSIAEHEIFSQYYNQYPTVMTLESNFQAFKRFFSELHLETLKAKFSSPTEEQLRQVYAATISRVLEIPHEISPDSQDYTTSTTLVPILDFVNHATGTDANAAFDIDRTTGEITLRLIKTEPYNSQQKSRDSFEVFIQYATTIEVVNFYITYGFIPTLPQRPLDTTSHLFFNISIDRDFISTTQPERRLFYKWFNVVPAIQLCYADDEKGWVINDLTPAWEELLLPGLTNDSQNPTRWTYDKYAYETLVHFHCELEDVDNIAALRESYRSTIINQENNGVDFIEFPQVAWSLSYTYNAETGKQVRKRVTKDEALEVLHNLSEEERTETQDGFLNFLRLYLKWRAQQLASAKQTHELCSYEYHVLEHLLEKLAKYDVDRKSTCLFLSAIDKQIETIPLPPPILRDLKPAAEMTIPELTQDELRELESYDPAKYTDFFQEELDSFVDMFH